jgi:hypothetical protein
MKKKSSSMLSFMICKLSIFLLSGCKGKIKALLLSNFDSVAYGLNLLLVSQKNLLKDKTIA